MRIVNQIPKLKPRKADAHKGDFGRLCIIAGSVGMSGAAALAGRAALRAGAGLVRVATPKSVLPIVASIEPSFTTIALLIMMFWHLVLELVSARACVRYLEFSSNRKTCLWL